MGGNLQFLILNSSFFLKGGSLKRSLGMAEIAVTELRINNFYSIETVW
jgi:hypothetical protein